MQFSIIIPVYNIESYIKKCLNSVVMQNFTDYEIILVDDGSVDGSGRICDKYAQRYDCIKVFHQENAGQSQARNRGIMESVGDYILFLDGDDYWYSNEVLFQLSGYIYKKLRGKIRYCCV